MITKEQLIAAYTQKWGAIFPVEPEVFDSFITQFGLDWSLEKAVDLMQDFVASQGLYDPEAEASW